MGLIITSEEEHGSGSITTTYVNIFAYHKSKDEDTMIVPVRYYTSKARRDVNVNYISTPLNTTLDPIVLPMTMAEFTANSNIAADVYALLKTRYETQGKTVVDDI